MGGVILRELAPSQELYIPNALPAKAKGKNICNTPMKRGTHNKKFPMVSVQNIREKEINMIREKIRNTGQSRAVQDFERRTKHLNLILWARESQRRVSRKKTILVAVI